MSSDISTVAPSWDAVGARHVVEEGHSRMAAATTIDNAHIGSSIQVKGLSKIYNETYAVDDVSFTVREGEFLTLLGASGSGKSTTLMMIAGFVEPTSGTIQIAGQDIASLPPEKRNLGVVFQNYALFPHMNVFDNVAFPLKMRGWDRKKIEAKVKSVLELVELDSRRDFRISQLSGGQQQRVALARALVFEPPVLLMDEPMGALDRRLREQLQREVKRIQLRLGLTVISVTHDQEEALLMSDRIAIMSEGRIQQIDTPTRIYRAPKNRFVASFLGDSNFIMVSPVDGRMTPVEEGAAAHGARHAMVRPEDMRVVKPGEAAEVMVQGTVTSIEFPGSAMRVAVQTHAGSVEARLHREDTEGLSEGAPVTLGWKADDMVLFEE
ncbi:putative spermidine/putrescine transport system ATP-binding protein [Rhodoligotrophos appendicifer]|uniref:ABC transporter ATP-binding protein n=1 Tax=Rhodoligotrophos appendicifer TaxID=987056 RepID=UPI001186441A|nr:ABC transporter ATP-binding protein [Rhodoligotrophos appendicifer]